MLAVIPTAASLQAAGVRARFAGNIMMDGLASSGNRLGMREGELVIAVLPGSRDDAARALEEQIVRLHALAVLLESRGTTIHALVSAAPSADAAQLIQAISRQGIALETMGSTGGVIATGAAKGIRISLVRGAFGDLIAAADLVFGQAGTANEQAAGAGKPVIAAAIAGEQPGKMGWYRMRQQKLLGDALLVLPAEPSVFAAEVLRLLDDPARIARMAAVGRERMGLPGGAAAVAQAALSAAENNCVS